MNVLGIALVIAIAAGLFVLSVSILVWNLTDIVNVGFNFWNVFWILLVLVGNLGGASKAGNS